MFDIGQLIIVIARALGIDPSEMNADSQLEDIKNWDSLSALRVMNAVERASTIKIPLYQFLKAKSVRDIAGLLKLEAL